MPVTDAGKTRKMPAFPGPKSTLLPKSIFKFGTRIVASIVVACVLFFAGTLVPSGSSSAVTEKSLNSPIAAYHADILPILEKHCYECHGDGYDKGKIAFDALDTDEKILEPELWLKVLNNTRAGLMPAEQKPRLSSIEQQKLEGWIKQSVFRIDARNPDPGRVTLRRMNRVEYRNTVRDLLGVDFNTEVEFPPDDTGFGFDNIGDALTMSPMLMEKYVAAAQAIVNEAVPTVSRKMAEEVIWGQSFTGTNATVRNGKMRLSFSQAANAAASFKTPAAGNYRVVVDLDVNSRVEFDPARCRVIVKVDGQEIVNQEFGYYVDKPFSFEHSQAWQPAEHQISVELQPIAPAAGQTTKPNAIDIVLQKVTLLGPVESSQWVAPKNYARFFPKPIPASRAKRRAYARELLGDFAAKAYRRPLTDDTAERLAELAQKIYSLPGKSFEQGVAQAMTAVLASPRFLFKLEEPATPLKASSAFVDEYSLASRLSYFLWSTMPDEELSGLAARGELRRHLKAQVDRMLADPRADNFARNFTGQWLQARDAQGVSSNAVVILARDNGREEDLRALRTAFEKDDRATIERLRPTIFPPKMQLDSELRTAMQRETEMFFAHIVREDRPLTELIDSDYTFVNEKLAKLYGMPGITGPEMRKITLPKDSPRGGVLTQASALAVTSNPDRTSPVKRGLFVLANFLGTPPPPPPANVPALEATEGEMKDKEPTLRDSLKVHRENPACASCHNRMDPIGLGFENFNAMGMYRETERKQPIVATGQLITGETFNSVSELKKILANDHREEFYRTLTGKVLTYATGRGTEYYDVQTIDAIVTRLDQNGGRFSALLMGVIESAPFQKMRTQATMTVAN